MKERMKILIGYDGSECADAAISELRRAGLPTEADVLMISVAEQWLSPLPFQGMAQAEYIDSFEDLLKETEALTRRAAEWLRAHFPSWELLTEANVGSPATVLLNRADEWKADLIVVGSHGRTALGRFVLGSISQRVATEARCSVRIGRGRVLESIRPIRVLIGVDGSPGAEAAVREVAARSWPAKTEARLITLTGSYRNVIGAEAQDAIEHTLEMQKKPETELRNAGLSVSLKMDAGDPRQAIVEEAHRWGADSIFVGARGLSRMKRFLLGSVSSAVAARAHCSVEIVRP